RQPKSTAGFKQLLRELSLRGHERRELDERLRGMVRRGELVEIGRDRYALPLSSKKKEPKVEVHNQRNLVRGRLHMHRDGFGFVIPDSEEVKERYQGDIFIPPPAIGPAMHGDHVIVEVTATKRDGRAEGRIVKLAGRAHYTVVGTFHHGD